MCDGTVTCLSCGKQGRHDALVISVGTMGCVGNPSIMRLIVTHPNRVNPVPATKAMAAVNVAPRNRGAAAATSASKSVDSTGTRSFF